MADDFHSIGILAKKNDPSVASTLTRLVEDLLARGKRVVIEAELIGHDGRLATCSRERLGGACDLAVVVGGDGTLLHAGRALAAFDTPLLGVNLGRLGFMVDVLPAEMVTTLDQVFAGHYIAESRLMLSARIVRADGGRDPETFSAINECVVRNQTFARVLDFDTYMNGDFISHHRADGMVVATPTGSTAYALSGGGPVLHPGLQAVALVPICPHSLTDRPLIVDSAHVIEVEIDPAQPGTALLTSDGQISQPLYPGDRVCIQRDRHDLKLIHPLGYDYFNILRRKLQWGRGQQRPAS